MVAKIVPGGTFYFSWKKRGDQIFQRGTDLFQKILVPPDHFFLKYLVRGDCFWGDQLLRDSNIWKITRISFSDLSKDLGSLTYHNVICNSIRNQHIQICKVEKSHVKSTVTIVKSNQNQNVICALFFAVHGPLNAKAVKQSQKRKALLKGNGILRES